MADYFAYTQGPGCSIRCNPEAAKFEDGDTENSGGCGISSVRIRLGEIFNGLRCSGEAEDGDWNNGGVWGDGHV